MKTISFFILTYNRPVDTQEALENILFFLDHPADIFIEIVVVNNNSSVDYQAFENFIQKNEQSEHHRIIYIKNTENKGVAGGRNQAMEIASGEILISLDDDAEFREKDLLPRILDLFEKYKDQNVAFLTFQVVEQSDGRIFVASKAKDSLQKKELFTNYFAGGAHALKKSLLKDIGLYNVSEKYGAEEYDLSFKLLEKGYRIVHTNEISILHKKNPDGRFDYAKQNGQLLKNKSLLAYRFLPIRYYYSHLFFWSLFFLKETNLKVFQLFKYLRETHQARKSITRKVISPKTIQYIKSIGGRLTY
ncbi:MAG: glycosyltransferase [Bacteroidota bacterium]